MDYHCPFDHEDLPLPAAISDFLELGMFALFGGDSEPQPRSSAAAGDPAAGRSAGHSAPVPVHDPASPALAALAGPVLRAFEPWADRFRDAGTVHEEIRTRVCHQAVEQVGTLLAEAGLVDELESRLAELEDRRPELQRGFEGLPLEERARLRRAYVSQLDSTARDLGRGMLRVLFRSLPPFLERLLAAARAYQAGKEAMRNAFGKSAGLWDLEPGTWAHRGIAGLDRAAGVLEQDSGLRELLETLGRRALADPRFQPPLPARGSWNLELALGRQELVGLSQGRDLDTVLPSELAILAVPAARKRFFRDYAEERIPSFAYRTREQPRQGAEPPSRKERDLGPFILCVDTSGSMAGEPEAVAKALSLAAIRRAIQTQRGLVLVSFSDRAESLEIRPERLGADYLDFLSHSFHGGTDLRPALAEALRQIGEKGWHDADLLIVSDFRVPKIMVKKSGQLRMAQQAFGTRIHALSIGRRPIEDNYNMFESRWLCHPEVQDIGSRVRETG